MTGGPGRVGDGKEEYIFFLEPFIIIFPPPPSLTLSPLVSKKVFPALAALWLTPEKTWSAW